MRKHWFSAMVGFLGVALALALTPASAQSVEEFYKDKTVTVYVGYSPGGGYDTYARTIARHIGKHIPGNPSVIAVNRPGAGSMLLTNELYNILPKDGTAFGLIGNGMAMEPLFGTAEAQFEPAKFNWIGSANSEVNLCVSWHTSPVKNWQEMLTTPMTVGGSGPASETVISPQVLNSVFGTKLKIVTGYPGTNDIMLAIERGEVDGVCGTTWTTVKSRQSDALKEGKLKILIQMAAAQHQELADVPLIMDVAKTQEDREALMLFFARLEFARPFVAPPDVPADRVEALRAAFMATLADPEFLAEAEKQSLEVQPIAGERVGSLIADMYKASPEAVQRVKEMSGR